MRTNTIYLKVQFTTVRKIIYGRTSYIR